MSPAIQDVPADLSQVALNETTDVSVAPRRPLLSEVVKRVCDDARLNPIQYSLRSNVGHDGE